MRVRARSCLLPLALFTVFACDEAKQVEADGEASSQANLQAAATPTITATDFELAAVVELVEREDVRDAESLEALLNAEESTIRVDVDGDGQRDFIAVHELGEARATDADVKLEAEADGAVAVSGEDGETVQFELRAVPSSSVKVEAEADAVTLAPEAETVVVATVDVELHTEAQEVVVTASYAPTVVVVADVEVEHHYVHRIALEHRHDHLVVVGSPFVAWVWVDVRPVYVGHVHLPPGHAKHLGLHWHHHGHGPHHDHGHGGPDKVHIKSGGGGPDKVQVKVKGGHTGGHAGGKVKVKGKGGKGKH